MITKHQVCAKHLTCGFSLGGRTPWWKGKLPSRSTRDGPAEGGVLLCLPKAGCLPAPPPASPRLGAKRAAGEDHLPPTVPPKQSQGSAGCPLVSGCCCCPLSAPRSAPAPTSEEPPRTAPCLRTGGKTRESLTSAEESGQAPHSRRGQKSKEAEGHESIRTGRLREPAPSHFSTRVSLQPPFRPDVFLETVPYPQMAADHRITVLGLGVGLQTSTWEGVLSPAWAIHPPPPPQERPTAGRLASTLHVETLCVAVTGGHGLFQPSGVPWS